MKRTHEFAIDGVTYASTHYVASRGFRLLVRLAKVASEPMARIANIAVNGAKGLDTEVDPELIAAAISALTSSVTEDESLTLVHEILHSTLRNNQPINFDIDFSGNYFHLFKVLKEVISFQYADFLAKSPPASAPTLKQRRA